MKTSRRFVTAFVLWSLAGLSPNLALASVRGEVDWGGHHRLSRPFNAEGSETVRGVVAKVEEAEAVRSLARGIHLVLKTAEGDLPVHLAPEWFLSSQAFRIEPNDVLEIKGLRGTVEGQPALMAVEVRRGHELLKLREENGRPLWTGEGAE